MPINKHKIFKISIDVGFSFNESAESVVNEFLSNPNNIYVGHSIALAWEDKDEHGKIRQTNGHLIISLIYKDLSATSLDLTKVSKKVLSILFPKIHSKSKSYNHSI